jgi:pyridoxal/pyridoxine/pyridoxamine kinase
MFTLGSLPTAIRYVGNKMATFVMQSLGCDVAAINTVHFSASLLQFPILTHPQVTSSFHLSLKSSLPSKYALQATTRVIASSEAAAPRPPK